jgi:hypothetical protein
VLLRHFDLPGNGDGIEQLAHLLGFLVVYRVFQDYVRSSLLMRAGVELHPLLGPVPRPGAAGG